MRFRPAPGRLAQDLAELGEYVLTGKPTGEQSADEQRDRQNGQNRVGAPTEVGDGDQHRHHDEGQGS
jgi:hypothetical protein